MLQVIHRAAPPLDRYEATSERREAERRFHDWLRVQLANSPPVPLGRPPRYGPRTTGSSVR